MVNDLTGIVEQTWDRLNYFVRDHFWYDHFWYLKAFSRKQMFINVSWMRQKKKIQGLKMTAVTTESNDNTNWGQKQYWNNIYYCL